MVRLKATLDHRHLPLSANSPSHEPVRCRIDLQAWPAFKTNDGHADPSPIGRACCGSRHRTRCGTEWCLANRKSEPIAPVTRNRKEHPPARGCPHSVKTWKVRTPTFDRLVPATSRTNIRNTPFPDRVAEAQLSVPLTQLPSRDYNDCGQRF